MPFKNSKTKASGKRYRLELSRTSFFFWCLGSLFLLAWIFVLGIFVGRGFLPQGVKTLSKLRLPIAKFQDMVGNKKAADLDGIKGLDEDPEFEFYDKLSAKKGDVANKSESDTKKAGGQTKLAKHFETDKRSTKKDEIPKKSQSDFVKGGGQTDPTIGINATETGGAYTVQVASLESENKAVRMADRLKKRGYPAYIHEVSIKGKTYYRVKCGTINNRKEAGDFKSLLAQKENINGFVSKEATKSSQPDLTKERGQIRLKRDTSATEIIGTYTVQIASLESENKAARMADRLKKRGYPAYIRKVNIEGKTYYRVRCGRFKEKKEASDCERLLARKETIKGFVTKIEGD
jgi:cell division septation protein DedD